AADEPQRAVGLQNASRFRQPGLCKAVISREAIELVPMVGDGIDVAAVGSIEIAAELEVVRRVGEDEIDRCAWQRAHRLDAVARQYPPERQLDSLGPARARRPQFRDYAHSRSSPLLYPQGAQARTPASSRRLATGYPAATRLARERNESRTAS